MASRRNHPTPFKCKIYQDLNGKIEGETPQELLRINNEEDIAKMIKQIIRRKDNEI